MEKAGNKAAQRRAVLILGSSAVPLSAVPLLPVAWLEQSPWLAFALYLVARLLFAWGTNQFDANYNAAINNSAFLPPHDVPRALDVFYCSGMLGSFCGSLLALLIVQSGLQVRWALLLPAPLVLAMAGLVELIREAAAPPPPHPPRFSPDAKPP